MKNTKKNKKRRKTSVKAKWVKPKGAARGSVTAPAVKPSAAPVSTATPKKVVQLDLFLLE